MSLRLTLAALATLASLAMMSPALALNCGTKWVTEGLSAYEVLKICGEPAWVTPAPSPFGDEEWIYDLGSTKFMRRLTFRNDRLVRIEELGRGG
jgi:hypothetical protein